MQGQKLRGGRGPWGSRSWGSGYSFKQGAREGLTEQMTFGQISEGDEKVSHMTIREKSGQQKAQ